MIAQSYKRTWPTWIVWQRLPSQVTYLRRRTNMARAASSTVLTWSLRTRFKSKSWPRLPKRGRKKATTQAAITTAWTTTKLAKASIKATGTVKKLTLRSWCLAPMQRLVKWATEPTHSSLESSQARARWRKSFLTLQMRQPRRPQRPRAATDLTVDCSRETSSRMPAATTTLWKYPVRNLKMKLNFWSLKGRTIKRKSLQLKLEQWQTPIPTHQIRHFR